MIKLLGLAVVLTTPARVVLCRLLCVYRLWGVVGSMPVNVELSVQLPLSIWNAGREISLTLAYTKSNTTGTGTGSYTKSNTTGTGTGHYTTLHYTTNNTGEEQATTQ